MVKRIQLQGVVSGPDPDGCWHWRPVDGTKNIRRGSNVIKASDADPGWHRGSPVLMNVRHTATGWAVTGRADVDDEKIAAIKADAPLVMMGGRALDQVLPTGETGPQTGQVLRARVDYDAADRRRPGDRRKVRPVVICQRQAGLRGGPRCVLQEHGRPRHTAARLPSRGPEALLGGGQQRHTGSAEGPHQTPWQARAIRRVVAT